MRAAQLNHLRPVGQRQPHLETAGPVGQDRHQLACVNRQERQPADLIGVDQFPARRQIGPQAVVSPKSR